MIAEIKFKNLFSFRDEAAFSFEADKSKEMESYHVVEVVPGVRLLKFAVIYGANASGKSNFIKACDFLKSFTTRTPSKKSEETGVVPFLLNRDGYKDTSDISITFYVIKENQLPVKFVYSFSSTKSYVEKESLIYYPSQQPATIFERGIENGVSKITFGNKVKLSAAAQEEIALKCLPNMSALAAYMQVNVNVPEMEDVLYYFQNNFKDAVTKDLSLFTDISRIVNEDTKKEYVLQYLKEADFNITDIIIDKDPLPYDTIRFSNFVHSIKNKANEVSYFEFASELESQGTLRTLELAGHIKDIITDNAFLAIDEIESSLHPKLIEYIVERFLNESKNAQLLVTTHYDGLLAQDDLLRNDNIWFTEKNSDGATVLYPLTDFNGLNRISSLQKAYRFGKFGAIPNL